jgi:hypothetical protein
VLSKWEEMECLGLVADKEIVGVEGDVRLCLHWVSAWKVVGIWSSWIKEKTVSALELISTNSSDLSETTHLTAGVHFSCSYTSSDTSYLTPLASTADV